MDAISKSRLRESLEVMVLLNGLPEIAKILAEICDHKAEREAVINQDVRTGKAWATCSEACSLLEKVANWLP